MDALRGVKILVGVMTTLLVVGIGVAGYGVYSKVAGGAKEDGAADPAPPEAAAGERAVPAAVAGAEVSVDVPSGTLHLDQPPGSRIAEASTSGALLTLRVDGGGLSDRVLVVDLRDGRVVATVLLEAP